MKLLWDRELLLFAGITFVWSGIVGLGAWHWELLKTQSVWQLVVGMVYMLSPAAATVFIEKFNWPVIVEKYGLNFKKIRWRQMALVAILFLFVWHAVYLILNYILGNILGMSGVGHISLHPAEWAAELGKFAELPEEQLQLPGLPVLLSTGFIGAVFAGFTINALFAFGEELGWRGYLLKKLEPLGFFRSALITGILWGLWHYGLILQGTNYPDSPYMGVLYMCGLTMALSLPMQDLTRLTGTVYTAAVLHGMFNASNFLQIIVVDKVDYLGGTLGMTGWLSIITAWFITNEIVIKIYKKQGAANV